MRYPIYYWRVIKRRIFPRAKQTYKINDPLVGFTIYRCKCGYKYKFAAICLRDSDTCDYSCTNCGTKIKVTILMEQIYGT